MIFAGEERLREMAKAEGLDAVALVPGSNFRHVYGQDFGQNERLLVVVIPRDGESVAVVPDLEAASFDLIGFAGAVFLWRDNDGPGQAMADCAEQLQGLARIGVEGQRMRVMEHHQLRRVLPDVDIRDCHSQISETLRLRKTPDDIEKIRRAVQISEAALERMLGLVRVGQTEAEIEGLLLENLFASGAEGLSFHPIVAAGDNSFRPHAKARPDYRVKPGDALLVDSGGTFQGYRADITRTFFIGDCDDRSRAVYETVQRANAAGHAATRPGVTCHELDDTVLRVLEASPFKDYIRTKTGHGLGLDVHEDPYIMRGNPRPLEPGMVFTIEPGLYLPDALGVRIEDDVVVTQTGVETLTTFSRELRIVG